MDLEYVDLDLDEIQTLDSSAIVRRKLFQAYERLNRPVIVEDISAELDNLNGLPGTFIKFFEQKLGNRALYLLSQEGTGVRIICTMGYYDGDKEIIADGTMSGKIVKPVDSDGFGFDVCIVPDGYDKTLLELGSEVKNKMSHRFKAATALRAALAA